MRLHNKEILKQLKSYINDVFNIEGLRFIIEPEVNKFRHKSLSFPNFRPDFFAEISFHNIHINLAGEIFENQSSSVFEDKMTILKSFIHLYHEYQPLFLAKYLSLERRKRCKEEGIFFFDLSGNAYLKYKSILIEREGFANRFPEKRNGRNPFSDKASIVLRETFKHKDKLWGVREIAQASGLNAGFISRLLKEMEKKRYFERKDLKYKLLNPKNILADWISAYNFEKNEKIKYFCLAKNPEEILDKLRNINIPSYVYYALGLHAGAGLISPHTRYKEVHIYVKDKQDIEYFKKELALKKVEEGANVIFLLPYYKHSVFYDRQNLIGLWVVSDIQLYLDLYNYPIRGLEQAEHLFNKRLKNIIENRN